MKTQLEYITREFGVTHRQLAELLGVQRLLVTRCLLGQRQLEGEAEGRLALLYALALKSVPLKEGKPVTRKAASAAELQQLNQLKAAYQRRHKQLRDKHLKIQRLRGWLRAIKTNSENLELSKRQQRCLEELEYLGKRRQERMDPEEQLVSSKLEKLEEAIAKKLPLKNFRR